jgi:YggT family protein
MFIFANLLNAIAIIIHYVLQIYMWLVIARAVISWVNPDPYNPIVSFLYQATEPVLYRIRRLLPFGMMPIDISPIIVFVIIMFLDSFLVQTIQEIAFKLR